MSGNDSGSARYRFADLVLDSGQRRIWRNGENLALPRLSFDFLLTLVEAAPNVVSHDEMAARVWGARRIVTPENQAQRLLMIRKSLGDSASEPRYIESLRGQGFRLIPPVVRVGIGDVPERSAPDVSVLRYGRSVSGGILGVGILGLFMAFGLVGIEKLRTPEDSEIGISSVSPPMQTLPDSIAVLPFRKLNADGNASYFAEAVHAELVNELGRRTDLNVIGRASVLHYEGSSLPVSAISQQLRVEKVVTASVTYEDDRMHLITELIDARTGMQIWRDTYDAGIDDIFSLRLRLANGIGNALGSAPASNATDETDPSASGEAYAYYLRAMDIFGSDNIGTRPTAQTYLDQAIALDPDFAHAYAGKALVHVFSAINSGDAGRDGTMTVGEREALARDYISRAVEIDPQTDLAHYAAGVLHMFSWRFHEARSALTTAVEISPQHGTFLAQLGWLEVCGLGIPGGIRYSQRAATIDPQNPYVFERLSAALSCAGDLPGALAATETALDLDATSFANELARAMLVGLIEGSERGVTAYRRLEPLLTEQRALTLPAVAWGYARLGQYSDARRVFERFAAIAETRQTGPANWYMAYLAVNDYDRAHDMLEQAIDNRALGPGFYTLVSFLNNAGDRPPFDQQRFLALRDRLRASARAVVGDSLSTF